MIEMGSLLFSEKQFALFQMFSWCFLVMSRKSYIPPRWLPSAGGVVGPAIGKDGWYRIYDLFRVWLPIRIHNEFYIADLNKNKLMNE